MLCVQGKMQDCSNLDYFLMPNEQEICSGMNIFEDDADFINNYYFFNNCTFNNKNQDFSNFDCYEYDWMKDLTCSSMYCDKSCDDSDKSEHKHSKSSYGDEGLAMFYRQEAKRYNDQLKKMEKDDPDDSICDFYDNDKRETKDAIKEAQANERRASGHRSYHDYKNSKAHDDHKKLGDPKKRKCKIKKSKD